MKQALCFVQFLHPGGEHGTDGPDLKRWNVRPLHRRKFIRAGGMARGRDSGSERAELIFWGEWEPESHVTEIPRPVREGPRYLHDPFYSVPPPAGWRQNTDPFVFGAQFHYTGCMQHTRQGPTQLRFLERGSVILFGSCIKRKKFVVDTVFVVDRWLHHTQDEHELPSISAAYRAATISPWYSGSKANPDSHRLYFGATPKKAVNGMFSFFPASTLDRHPNGFARPQIDLDVITSNQTQGKRLNRQTSVADVRRLWENVVDQVQERGLWLGTHADLPQPETS